MAMYVCRTCIIAATDHHWQHGIVHSEQWRSSGGRVERIGVCCCDGIAAATNHHWATHHHWPVYERTNICREGVAAAAIHHWRHGYRSWVQITHRDRMAAHHRSQARHPQPLQLGLLRLPCRNRAAGREPRMQAKRVRRVVIGNERNRLHIDRGSAAVGFRRTRHIISQSIRKRGEVVAGQKVFHVVLHQRQGEDGPVLDHERAPDGHGSHIYTQLAGRRRSVIELRGSDRSGGRAPASLGYLGRGCVLFPLVALPARLASARHAAAASPAPGGRGGSLTLAHGIHDPPRHLRLSPSKALVIVRPHLPPARNPREVPPLEPSREARELRRRSRAAAAAARSEVPREDDLGKFFLVRDDEAGAAGEPVDVAVDPGLGEYGVEDDGEGLGGIIDAGIVHVIIGVVRGGVVVAGRG
mmetsp:Transcript_14414/g.34756  ORF Transcript_14414/g.34756 Transcript_14414/m.34756 type:complete len:413 (-) Transcript_14414:332-1570(-)